MNDTSQVRIEGIVVSRVPRAGVLHFNCEVLGTVYACVDATGEMGPYSVMAGQKVSCFGRWSRGIKDLFEVSRIEKMDRTGS